jgi:hypothetical protein
MDLETEGCIILTTHNYQAKRINEERMNKLSGASFKFSAQIEGEFPEYSYPTDPELEIKSGAQVMFVKNDSSPEKRYFNGKIGKVSSIEDDVIYVKCSNDSSTVAVGPESWQNAKYGLDEAGEIVEAVLGTFTQYPLKAAWAITIHKSQGLTFDKVIIDAAAAFAHGQVYVALSRCRTFEGLFLTSMLSPRVLIKNSSVSEFSEKVKLKQPGKEQLQRAAVSYQQSLLYELFDLSLVKNQSGYLLKKLDENREKIYPELLESFRAMDTKIKSQMVEIAVKFNLQIENLLADNPEIGSNLKLQGRVKKAVGYFTELLKSCTAVMSNMESMTDIDNKEICKAINESLRRFQGEILKKAACMESCREGFLLKAYLKARSMGSIEKPIEKKRKPAWPEVDDFGALSEDNALFAKLKAWRYRKAREENAPEFMLLQQKTMMQIASMMPSSSKALKAIKGMGKRKVNRFGEEILRIISEHCAENGKPFSYQYEPFEETDALRRKEKVNTRKVTFDLFRSGKILSEIASERNLALSTIEGHIAHYISKGELGIDRFLTSDKVSRIREYFLSQGKRELSPAKNHFGEEFTYGELRMMLAHMDYEGMGKEQNDIVNMA